MSEDRQFTFIDLFAGVGGFHLAFERAGGKCVFASEIDKFARQTYEANFGLLPSGDIREIDADSIPDHDILAAGFPCQPFSLAGVSKYNSLGKDHGFLDATRGTLFFDIARILKAKRPAAFLLENVKNLKSHDKGRTFQVIKKTLAELEYKVYDEVIDARNVVPQHRERVFIVGFRKDIDFNYPSFPETEQRLQDILDPDVDEKYTLSDKLWQYLQDYKEKHRKRGNGFGFGMPDLDGVSRTLSARYHKDGSEILINQGKDRNPRRMTPRECGRLMGFPENFELPCSDTQTYQQFGNAVVVKVAERVAESMVKKLNDQWPQWADENPAAQTTIEFPRSGGDGESADAVLATKEAAEG
jgi:DNA (cytosine-5)-methyltransferase 1